jgi:hypothetical protein
VLRGEQTACARGIRSRRLSLEQIADKLARGDVVRHLVTFRGATTSTTWRGSPRAGILPAAFRRSH